MGKVHTLPESTKPSDAREAADRWEIANALNDFYRRYPKGIPLTDLSPEEHELIARDKEIFLHLFRTCESGPQIAEAFAGVNWLRRKQHPPTSSKVH